MRADSANRTYRRNCTQIIRPVAARSLEDSSPSQARRVPLEALLPAGLSRADVLDVAHPKRGLPLLLSSPAAVGASTKQVWAPPVSSLPGPRVTRYGPAPIPVYAQERFTAAIAPWDLGELVLVYAADPAEELGKGKISVREHADDKPHWR